jgi:CubicO group peptidase (beta-lactamase class C family)
MKGQARLGLPLVIPLLAWGCTSSSGPEDHAPEVSITAPLAGATFMRGDTVEVEVNASDPDGAVVAVRFYIDSRHVSVDSTSPYLFRWDTHGEDIGGHVLRAVAVDDDGYSSGRNIAVTIRWGDVAPEQLDDGWETSTATAQGIDAERLAAMMDEVGAGDYEFLHAILVARNGKLVFEEYFGDFGRYSLQHVQSTTKSVTSALIGIAIDRGEIGGVNDPMVDYLPEYAHLFDGGKEQLTIQHCLMMADGLEWNEHSIPYSDPSNDNTIGNNSVDYVAYVLGKPLVREPGTVWYYNSGCSMTLGAILRNATGLRADAYADQYLFDPLGIAPASWQVMGSGHIATHGGLFLRPRDMAKFGQLFLQDGVWEGEQVISAEWVAESTLPRLTSYAPYRYGYQWWFKEMNGYDVPFTAGGGGQYIYVVPELGLVVVTAADPYVTDYNADAEVRLLDLVERRILPAASY